MKRIITVILTAAMLLCMSSALAAASPGSSGDPLISKTYIDGTFTPGAVSDGNSAIQEGFADILAQGETKLKSEYSSLLSGLRVPPVGYTFADSFTPLSLTANGAVSVVTGGSFVLSGGSAALTVIRGTVINVSTGETVPSGASLTANQRYFCAEDTEASFASADGASCLVDGYYKTARAVYYFDDVAESDWFYSYVQFVCGHNMFAGMSEKTFGPNTGMTRAMLVTVLYKMSGETVSGSAGSFSDVPSGTWYTDAVAWASENGIVSGYGGGIFGPENEITREQIAVILLHYASYKGYDTSRYNDLGGYSDADDISAWAISGMSWANANGIINGMSATQLAPKQTATRAQVAAMLTNFYNAFVSF